MDLGFVFLMLLIFAPGLISISAMISSQREKRRRMEMLHQERMAALEKGVPLPELPSLEEVVQIRTVGPRPKVPLLLGIIFLCAGVGAMLALLLTSASELSRYWTLPLPLAFVGMGLMFYHLLSRERGN